MHRSILAPLLVLFAFTAIHAEEFTKAEIAEIREEFSDGITAAEKSMDSSKMIQFDRDFRAQLAEIGDVSDPGLAATRNELARRHALMRDSYLKDIESNRKRMHAEMTGLLLRKELLAKKKMPSAFKKEVHDGIDAVADKFKNHLIATYAQPLYEPLRTWTDSTGKHKVQAKFVSLEDEMVTLWKSDAKIISLPIKRLSVSDRNYAMEAQFSQER